MDAVADTTLEFTEAELDAIYARISPFIVGVGVAPAAAGFILDETEDHYRIAVHSFVMSSKPYLVRYANNKRAFIEKVVQNDEKVTILYVKRDRGDQQNLVPYEHLGPQEAFSVCGKVVTFVPYRNGIAMFKGHIISVEDLPVIEFTFSCPYATQYLLEDDDEMIRTMHLTLGAPVFNLEGHLVGVLDSCGRSYDVKTAISAGLFYHRMEKVCAKKCLKSISKAERKPTNYKHGQGAKCAKKGKKSNSKSERKHKEAKHGETDGQAHLSYKEPRLETTALQHSKVKLTWDNDEPESSILRKKSKDDKGMEIKFNTDLEDLSKRILDGKSTEKKTVLEMHQEKMKRKARKRLSKDDEYKRVPPSCENKLAEYGR